MAMNERLTTAVPMHGAVLDDIVARLEGELSEVVTHETLEHHVRDAYEHLAAQASIPDHLPVLVEHFARQRRRAMAKQHGVIEGHPAEVLFVCERNDGASQMAAALFNARAGERAHAHSAGARPSGELRAEAVAVLAEIGLHLDDAFPKPVTREIEAVVDVIVTLDAHDDVDVIEGTRYESWHLPDHRGEGHEGHRLLRDELSAQVDRLVDELVGPLT